MKKAVKKEETKPKKKTWKDILKITGIPVLFASLCCLSPIILVLIGLSTVTFATTLTDVLYGQYKWAFRALGLLFLAIALIIHFRKQKICTLDDVKKHRRKVINTILIVFIVAVAVYVLWLYVIVHYIGAFLNIWPY